jgi:hypothetical protein
LIIFDLLATESVIHRQKYSREQSCTGSVLGSGPPPPGWLHKMGMLAEPEFPAMALLVGQPAFRRAVLMKNDGLPFAESLFLISIPCF